MSTPKLRIAHLYPDLLNLYGDIGNITTITKRCEWRGIKVETDSIWSWTNADYLAIKEFSYGGYLSASADYRLGSMNGNIQAGGQFEHYSFQSATSLNIVNDEISYGGYQDQTLDKQGKENNLSLFSSVLSVGLLFRK